MWIVCTCVGGLNNESFSVTANILVQCLVSRSNQQFLSSGKLSPSLRGDEAPSPLLFSITCYYEGSFHLAILGKSYSVRQPLCTNVLIFALLANTIYVDDYLLKTPLGWIMWCPCLHTGVPLVV